MTSPRFSTEQVAPGRFLHLESSERRKTNLLSFAWVGDLGPDCTSRALISSLLLRGTENYPDLRAISRHLESLYGTSCTSDVMKAGERHVIVFRLEFPNDRYLPADDGILEGAVAFLDEVLARPRLEDRRFSDELVAQEKVMHQRLIESLFNDKASYAMERCIQEMCPDEEFRRYEYGRVEDLPGLDAGRLTEDWRRILSGSQTHVYFSGDVDRAVAEAALRPLTEHGNGQTAELRGDSELRAAGEVRTVSEPLDVNQTKLVLGFRTGTGFGDPLLEPLIIGNGVLGQFAHSKLFRNVREKASLCYYASSSVNRNQGLLFISSGIEYERKDEALERIQEQVAAVQAGDISDEELGSTQLAFENRLQMLEDSPAARMDVDLMWRLAGVEYDGAAYRKRLASVTREEIVGAFGRVQLDTVFLLHPERTE